MALTFFALDRGQLPAAVERSAADLLETLGQRDLLQVAAAGKRAGAIIVLIVSAGFDYLLQLYDMRLCRVNRSLPMDRLILD